MIKIVINASELFQLVFCDFLKEMFALWIFCVSFSCEKVSFFYKMSVSFLIQTSLMSLLSSQIGIFQYLPSTLLPSQKSFVPLLAFRASHSLIKSFSGPKIIKDEEDICQKAIKLLIDCHKNTSQKLSNVSLWRSNCALIPKYRVIESQILMDLN